MFNITGNLSPPLTVLELPFSHRLPRLSSGPNMLSHYVLERGKKKKSQEVGRVITLLQLQSWVGIFFLFLFAGIKWLPWQSSWTAHFLGSPLLFTPTITSVRCSWIYADLLCCAGTSLIPTLIHHYQLEPTQLFCRLRSTEIGWSGDRTAPKITWIKTLPATL